MKTDPFDDAIRRKLEGINPPFQDKNWTHFQRFMGTQGFPPSIWQTPARWLYPALTAAAVTGVLIMTVWQYRTNQLLTTHVQTLTRTVERMERTQLRLQQSVAMMASAPSHVDTVFLTGPATASPPPTWPGTADFPTRRGTTASRPAPPNEAVQTSGTLAAETPMHQPQERLTQKSTRQNRAGSDHIPVPQVAVNDQLGRQESIGRPTVNGTLADPTNPGRSPAAVPSTQRGDSELTTDKRTQPSFSARTQPSNENTRYNSPVTNQPSGGSVSVADSAASAGSLVGAVAKPMIVQPLSPRPLAATTEAFDASWQRHLRRVRYRSPYATSTAGSLATAVSTPTQRRDPVPVQFRVGLGGEAGTAQTGLGLHAEAIIANRWTIGTGLTSVSWTGDEYTNEQQFTAKTKRDFRYTYPGSALPMPAGPSMPRQLVDISRAAQSLVIPVQVGYRLGVGTFVLTPAVGLNLALNARETATYSTDRQPGFDDVRQSISAARPQSWYTNWTVGIGAERQWGQFAGQVSPVMYLPFQGNTASLNTVSAGLRARLYYRF